MLGRRRFTLFRPEQIRILPTDRTFRMRPADLEAAMEADIDAGRIPFLAIAKAIIGGEYEGFAKVIGNTETGDTLGVHLIGPHATDLVAEASLGFELEATPWEIGGSTHAHPTLSEVLGEAAMAVDGRSLNF